MVWYLVIFLTVPFMGEDVEKIFIDRFSSKEICEAWLPVAIKQMENEKFESMRVRGGMCRSQKIETKKPK